MAEINEDKIRQLEKKVLELEGKIIRECDNLRFAAIVREEHACRIRSYNRMMPNSPDLPEHGNS